MSKYSKNRKALRSSVVSFLLGFFVITAALGFLGNLLGEKIDEADKVENVTVYLVPGDTWESDGSAYGAWCWSDSGVPAGAFVLAADEDADGVYEVTFPDHFNRLLFVDLAPGASELGVDWSNKREQTANLSVPQDGNVYYHAYANEWSDASDLLYSVTTEQKTVYLNCAEWTCAVKPVVYYFDKTGKSEAGFIQMTQCGASQYLAYIPAGYTHVIFIEYESSEAVGTWDSILNQTSDLIIPTGTATYYNTATSAWEEPTAE